MHNTLGLAYAFGRQYDKAVNAYKAGLELAPRAAHIYANMAIAYAWAGKYGEAMKSLNASMAIDSTSVQATARKHCAHWIS